MVRITRQSMARGWLKREGELEDEIIAFDLSRVVHGSRIPIFRHHDKIFVAVDNMEEQIVVKMGG